MRTYPRWLDPSRLHSAYGRIQARRPASRGIHRKLTSRPDASPSLFRRVSARRAVPTRRQVEFQSPKAMKGGPFFVSVAPCFTGRGYRPDVFRSPSGERWNAGSVAGAGEVRGGCRGPSCRARNRRSDAGAPAQKIGDRQSKRLAAEGLGGRDIHRLGRRISIDSVGESGRGAHPVATVPLCCAWHITFEARDPGNDDPGAIRLVNAVAQAAANRRDHGPEQRQGAVERRSLLSLFERPVPLHPSLRIESGWPMGCQKVRTG